jgi:predicted metal-binding membrane protein
VLRLHPRHPADVNRPIEWVARHDRIVVVAALGAVVVLAWGLLLAGPGMDMPDARAGEHTADVGSLGKFLALLLMWTVMMVAMMLPSAAPTILLFAAEKALYFRYLRYFALGHSDAMRELSVVFTIRGKLIRVISARSMSRRERSEYARAKTEDD